MARDIITLRWLTGLISPGGWLLLATWGLQQVEPARIVAAPYALIFCFGALAAAALLSWYYNCGRVLFVAAAVGLTVWGFGQLAAAAKVPKFAGVFLLPLNFALFAWLKERGVVTPSGILTVGFIHAQVLGVVMLGEMEGGRLEAFLRWGEQPAGWTWMPLTAQLSFAAAGLTLLVLVFLRRTKVEGGLLWALVAVFVGLNQTAKPEALLFYAGAAGLILLFAVLEHSYDIAYRDELTGLPGRRALNEVLLQLGSHYAIAMCDVDHFKKFNDTYGHDAGDQVLRMVASKLSRVEGGGRAFRYGGEEFTVVFRGRSAREAQPFVESLREAIADGAFTLRGPDRPLKKPKENPEPQPKQSATITISIGLAEHSKRHSTSELVLDAADNALYLAKESGRNCVKLAEGTPS